MRTHTYTQSYNATCSYTDIATYMYSYTYTATHSDILGYAEFYIAIDDQVCFH